MINVLLSGCNGKMGKVITSVLEKDGTATIVCGYDINTQSCAYPVYDDLSAVTEKADVVIDFSNPAAADKVMDFCSERRIPLVEATTGLDEVQRTKLETISKKMPVFYSANMSVGVNLLISLVKKAAAILEGNFDIEIIEKHHNQKIDAPSGTALMIADEIASALKGGCQYVYDRHNDRKKRESTEIGIHSVRGGTIVGEHSVIFAGNDEVIEINHSAAGKEVFAVGAIKAARFLVGKQPGLYNMEDLVNS
ncbi:MAG: 4-hydroxy-tetrahydrodipicolinate reductase [Ruminococcaceae bacterium]|nr:4-hydroxy-tetrahydrodipicolinate reductase [Oscillospiraceae bacterium]